MFSINYPDDISLREETERFLSQWADSNDYIVAQTSGSTGKPKEIMLPKQDMFLSAMATNRRFSISESSRLLCPLSPTYIAGKMMIVRAIAADCCIALFSPSNRFTENNAVNDFIGEEQINLLPIVPSQCPVLESWRKLPQIRNIIIGGAPLSRDMENRLASHGDTAFFATYGMTETCSHVALRPLGLNSFEAMPGISFSLDSRECLNIHAPGYTFGSLQTNDIVHLSSPHSFEWLGRFDNVINSGGIKIFPEELERQLAPYLPFSFYIKGTPSAKWGEEATLVCASTAPLTDLEILSLCRAHLSPYHVPHSVLRLPQLSYTSSGKLRRI